MRLKCGDGSFVNPEMACSVKTNYGTCFGSTSLNKQRGIIGEVIRRRMMLCDKCSSWW